MWCRLLRVMETWTTCESLHMLSKFCLLLANWCSVSFPSRSRVPDDLHRSHSGREHPLVAWIWMWKLHLNSIVTIHFCPPLLSTPNKNSVLCWQAKRAVQRGATAVIFDVSENPDAIDQVCAHLKESPRHSCKHTHTHTHTHTHSCFNDTERRFAFEESTPCPSVCVCACVACVCVCCSYKQWSFYL